MKDLDLKPSAAVNVESRNSKRDYEFEARHGGEHTGCLLGTDAQARVVATFNGLGTGVDDTIHRTCGMKDKLRVALVILVRTGFCAVFEERRVFLVDKFCASFVGALIASGKRSLVTCKVVFVLDRSHVDLDVVPSRSNPLSAEDGDGRAIKKPVGDLIDNLRPSHLSVSQSVIGPSAAW